MRNVTITLDEQTARWARVEAAKRDVSLSKFIAGILQGMMDSQTSYAGEMKDFLSVRPRRLRQQGEPLPTREELYDRGRSR